MADAIDYVKELHLLVEEKRGAARVLSGRKRPHSPWSLQKAPVDCHSRRTLIVSPIANHLFRKATMRTR